MDLLCTENIMLNENELLCTEHSNSANSTGSPYSTYSSTSSGYNSTTSSTTCSSCSGSSVCTHLGNTSSLSTSSITLSCFSEEYSNGSAAGAGAPQGDTAHQQQQQQQQLNQSQSKHQQQPCTTVYTNNIINRSLDFVNTATEDPTFLTDRCLENALKAEEKRPHTVCTYFKTVQMDITPPMRKIVAEWMMEVCAEQKCQEEVVLLALNYMDRFLSQKSVRKTHLQILAAACLLLASKLREPSCRALSAELLVFYTDNSIYKGDLIQWELYVLSRLGWDLSSVTPLDFLELLLIRLPITNTNCPDLNVDKVRQHAQAFISLAAKEHYFSMYSASTIAASSIAAALNGLNWHLRTGRSMRYLLNRLTDLTSIEQDYLQDCMMKLEAIFEEHSRNLQPYLITLETHHHQQQQQQQQLHHHHHNHQQQQQPHKHNHHNHLQQQQKQQQNQHQQYQRTHNNNNNNNSHQQQQQQHQHQHHHHLKSQYNTLQQQQQQHIQCHSHQQQQQQQQQQHLHLQQHQIHLQHGAVVGGVGVGVGGGVVGGNGAANTLLIVGNAIPNSLLPDLTQTCKMQANAQKDVQDIQF